MTNLIILLGIWCTGIALCWAWLLARSLHRTYREEVTTDQEEGRPPGIVDEGRILSYARPPAKAGVVRRWPLLAVVFNTPVLLMLMLPPALPVVGLLYGHTYREAGTICAVALGLTLLALVLVTRRALTDIGGRPAAANWLPGRAVLCWVAVLLVAWSLLAWRAGRSVDAMVLRADEAARHLAIPNAQGATAASLYRQAGIDHPGQLDDGGWIFMSQDGLVSPPPPLAERDVARVMLLRQAAAMPVSGLVVTADEYTSGNGTPYVSAMPLLACLIRIHAVSEARAGRIESALTDVNAIQGMADHVGQGFSVLEAMMSCSIRAQGFDALQHVLPFVRDERMLDRIVLPEPSRPLAIMRRGVQGTFRAENRWMLATWLRGQKPIGIYGRWTSREDRFPFDDHGALMFLYRTPLAELDVRLVEEMAAQVPPMVPEDPAAINASPIRMNGWILPTQAHSFVAGKLARGVGGCVDFAVDQVAMCELARAAVASTRFRLRQGRLPMSFDELVQAGLLPSVPIDPFTGRPMRFALQDGHVFIYTIGGGRIDFGGKPYQLRGGIGIAGGMGVVDTNPGLILSDRPLWELPLVPPGAPATQPAAKDER